MRRAGDVCLLGTQFKLFGDGRVNESGRWEGDGFYAELKFTSDAGEERVVYCDRQPERPAE